MTSQRKAEAASHTPAEGHKKRNQNYQTNLQPLHLKKLTAPLEANVNPSAVSPILDRIHTVPNVQNLTPNRPWPDTLEGSSSIYV
jgi:hypothetical protein